MASRAAQQAPGIPMSLPPSTAVTATQPHLAIYMSAWELKSGSHSVQQVLDPTMNRLSNP